MQVIKSPITIADLQRIARNSFGTMVKAVVDVDRELIALDAEMHADLESLLLEDGSAQKNLWGINFYPDETGDDFLEFDSLINIRPSQGNVSRFVEDEQTQERIVAVTEQWISR